LFLREVYEISVLTPQTIQNYATVHFAQRNMLYWAVYSKQVLTAAYFQNVCAYKLLYETSLLISCLLTSFFYESLVAFMVRYDNKLLRAVNVTKDFSNTYSSE